MILSVFFLFKNFDYALLILLCSAHLVSYVSTKLVGEPALHPPIAKRISYGIRGVARGFFKSTSPFCFKSCSLRYVSTGRNIF